MVYVTLGTQGRDFSRCLEMVDQLIEERNINDIFIAQIGETAYKSKYFKCFNFIEESDYQQYVNKADVIISHAGSGALFSGIKQGKKIIAVARLSKYGEMANDHQLELVKKLTEEGYILDGTNSIIDAWDKLNEFTPRKNDFSCEIPNKIRELLNDWGIHKKKKLSN